MQICQSAMELNHASLPKITRQDSPIFTTDDLGAAVHQGEIISGLEHYEYDPVKSGAVKTVHPYVIVASQECDLLWDYMSRANGEPGKLGHVLIFEAQDAGELRKLLPPGKDIWKPITKNKNERYGFLEEVVMELDSKSTGIPELVVDFIRYFTLPTAELYRQISDPSPESAQRRCRLVTPYREHFQLRAYSFQARVALPLDHESVPQTVAQSATEPIPGSAAR